MTPTNRKERCRVQSFSVHPKHKHVLDMLDEMAQRERKSKSEIVIRCVEYYYNKKWPGNPQPPLFLKLEPPAENVTALREARLRKAITFLRFRAKLSYEQIARVVGMSAGYVYKHCRSLNHRPRFDNRRNPKRVVVARAFKRNLTKYQARFQAYLDGRIKVEEAFTL